MLLLSDLTKPLTRDEVTLSIYEALASVGVSTTTWKPGAWPRTVITGCSIVLSSLSQITSAIASNGFLELAEGAWLDIKAHYDYAVDRRVATFAEGAVTLVNASGGVYALDPDDLIVYNPTTKQTYRNTQPIALGALATVTGVVIRAVEAGAASSAAPNTITALETVLAGVTVTNPLALVGLDAEEDPELRTRCLEKLGSLSPFGPWDAYTYAAKNAVRLADGSPIGVTRVRTSRDGYGNVWTYVATATGAVTGIVTDPDTDLGAVDTAIQHNAAPLAVTAHTVSATALPVPVTYSIWVYATGATLQQVRDAVAANLTQFMANEPIGGNVIGADPGKIFRSALEAAIGATAYPPTSLEPLPIFRTVISEPAADVIVGVNEVPVLSTVTGTVVIVTPPEGF
jgi:phage-related baseplate assembly protein